MLRQSNKSSNGGSEPGIRRNKRQTYTPVACKGCQKRKTKCSGGVPCQQCLKREDSDCTYDRIQPSSNNLQSTCDPPSTNFTEPVGPNSSPNSNDYPLWPLNGAEVDEILEGFREDAETLYSFFNMDDIRRLSQKLNTGTTTSPHFSSPSQTESWDDLNDSRNLDFLKVLISCALAPRGGKAAETGHRFMMAVEENNFKRTHFKDVDLKDLAIATMLSVYQYQVDNLRLACRRISAAARLCLELGLQRVSCPDVEFMRVSNLPHWGNTLFWCIYTLDRRYSFMTNLQHTLQDSSVDFELLQKGISGPYIVPLVLYGCVGGKIISNTPKFGSASDGLDGLTRSELETEIDGWMDSTSSRQDSIQSSAPKLIKQQSHHRQVFFSVRNNQLRLSLYKDTLYTRSKLLERQTFARLAVQFAIDNVQILGQLSENPGEKSHYHHYKFFLLSSVASLYLAIRNAPQELIRASIPCLAGLNLLKSWAGQSVASLNFMRKVETLETVIDNIRLGTLELPDALPLSNMNLCPPGVTNGNEAIEADGPDSNELLSLEKWPIGLLTNSGAAPGIGFGEPTGGCADTMMLEMPSEQNLFPRFAPHELNETDLWSFPADLLNRDFGLPETYFDIRI